MPKTKIFLDMPSQLRTKYVDLEHAVEVLDQFLKTAPF